MFFGSCAIKDRFCDNSLVHCIDIRWISIAKIALSFVKICSFLPFIIWRKTFIWLQSFLQANHYFRWILAVPQRNVFHFGMNFIFLLWKLCWKSCSHLSCLCFLGNHSASTNWFVQFQPWRLSGLLASTFTTRLKQISSWKSLLKDVCSRWIYFCECFRIYGHITLHIFSGSLQNALSWQIALIVQNLVCIFMVWNCWRWWYPAHCCRCIFSRSRL